MDVPKFYTKKDLFDWLVKNKEAHIAHKMNKFVGNGCNKHADTFSFAPALNLAENLLAEKAIENPQEFTGNSIKVVSIINTTMIMDSHSDVHINGLWDKSLTENTEPYLLQEHKMSYANIISDAVTPSVKTFTWKDLGYNSEGKTQALVFTSTITKEENPFMFDKYLKGKVKNHSVGMQYVALGLAINDKDHVAENELWNKYINKIVNKSVVEEQGYFWAVTEAKFIEGSAVPIGSNRVTPTYSISEKSEQTEIQNKKINFSNILKHL